MRFLTAKVSSPFRIVPRRLPISVKKEGYVREEYGQRRPGGGPEANRSGRTERRLWPESPSTCSVHPRSPGRLRNEDGFPIANILVQAMRRSYGCAATVRLRCFPTRSQMTKESYRLYWLDPGDYYVNASYLPQLPQP